MLTIDVALSEHYNNETDEFEYETFKLELEHSLVSLSKWESIHKKPFLTNDSRTVEEVVDYIRCMCLAEPVPQEVFESLSQENFNTIHEYIGDQRTATTFSTPGPKHRSREIITSEVIYYWMASFHIPFECETWHLSRLFTLLQVCSLKNSPAKKMSRQELAARNRALNEQRKAQHNTKG